MEHSKKKLSKIILPVFIIFLMIFSTFGIILGYNGQEGDGTTETIEYNEYDFRFDGRWFAFRDNQRIDFLYGPLELETVYTGDLFNKIFNHQKIYLSVNPDDNFVSETSIFRSVIGTIANKPVIIACPEDKDDCEDLPLRDCKDSVPEQVLVIKLLPGIEDFQEDESCIAIIGDSEYFIKILEKLRLRYFFNG